MNKIGKILLVINTSLFIISLSIGFTILFRPFYYMHINYLNMEEDTGLTYEEIKEAYDDMMDYMTKNKEFSTGKLKYSSDGYNHFRDCKILFMIDFIVLIISSIVIVLRRKFLNNISIKNHSIPFISSISILITFGLVLIASLILGFNKCFNIFHNIFFLGKSNWILDPDVDEIIDILPKKYFMDCAILVLFIIGIISLIIIIKEKRRLHEKDS